MKSGLFLLSLCLPYSVHASELGVIYKNNDGVNKFKSEKHLESYETFMGLLAEDPYNPLLQFNLGASLAANGEEEKSVLLYKELLKNLESQLKSAKTPEEQGQILRTRFAVLYNLGVHYQTVKEPEEALKYYQLGLELIPDHKETKTNIEMMFSGGGNGKGKGDPKKDQQGEGEGQGNESQDPQDGDKNKDQKQQSEKPQEQDKNKKKEFDQSQMSKENLERFMDELKQQEQNIRAKMNKKGGKDAPKDKEW